MHRLSSSGPALCFSDAGGYVSKPKANGRTINRTKIYAFRLFRLVSKKPSLYWVRVSTQLSSCACRESHGKVVYTYEDGESPYKFNDRGIRLSQTNQSDGTNPGPSSCVRRWRLRTGRTEWRSPLG